ncbi:MAG: hypothetical protein V1728_04205 [Candidatus Micrarchaeota archaeon]
MATVCIMCHQTVGNGLSVQDTQVIRTIRGIKERLGAATGNVLVVCPACLPVHAKKRKIFEGKVIQHVIIGALVLLVLAGLPLLAGQFSILGFLFGIAIAVLVVGLCLVDYIPPLEDLEGAARLIERMEQERLSQAPASAPAGPRPVESIFSSFWPKKQDAPAARPPSPPAYRGAPSRPSADPESPGERFVPPTPSGHSRPPARKSVPARKSSKRKR